MNTQAEGPKLIEALSQFEAFSSGGSSSVRVFFAPGRVNLIGEHTDYNGGYVLPAALELGTFAFVRAHEGSDNPAIIRIASTSFPNVVTVRADEVGYHEAHDYANYPLGLIHEFQQLGASIPGMDILFYGNLPNGAGLSSSASIEVVTAMVLNTLLGQGLTNERLALLAQHAENTFVGVNCGIMDQFSSAMGAKDCAISLNCESLLYRLVPAKFHGAKLVITNTNKRRGLTDSKYNERRAECEQALRELQLVRPDLKYLADITKPEWPELEHHLSDPILRKRARHIVLENERAKASVNLLENGEIAEFGRLMNESHKSLRDDYEVTGIELDTLAEAAWEVPGCIGSRMTGAGFGGCTVSLVEDAAIESFQASVKAAYTKAIGYEPSFYISEIGDGVREVTEEVKAWRF